MRPTYEPLTASGRGARIADRSLLEFSVDEVLELIARYRWLAFKEHPVGSAEVLEYSGAFLQLYREEGWYLERTVHFVARVGLDHVKQRVLDDAAGRKQLWERLQFALEGEPDPWHQQEKAHVDDRQFKAIEVA